MAPLADIHRCLRWPLALLILLVVIPVRPAGAAEGKQNVTFSIERYEIEGATLFNTVTLKDAVDPFTGGNMTTRDVEKARNRLEQFYHERGYPTVLVNIPQQKVTDGVVVLEVIEARIRRVEVTGNSYFTGRMIKSHMPSLEPGKILYTPEVQRDLASVNALSGDLEVVPKIEPGEVPSVVDVKLMVDDELPLHGSLSLSNRGTHNTSDLRLNADISYDNLWQRGHSIALQYQTAPEEPEEVQVVGLSYVLAAPWEKKHIMAFYGVVSDSETAFGRGFETIGEGFIVGGRYILPLPDYKRYTHNLSVGLDYKDFDESTQLGADEFLETPAEYMPLLLDYGSSIADAHGATRFNIGVNVAFRNLVTEQEEFREKRAGARGSYIYLTAGVNRRQQLPWALELYAGIDGQLADQPLISNEQYIAGGMEDVRGYKENEESGDNALHATTELSWHGAPSAWDRLTVNPFVFVDTVWLQLLEPLPGQKEYKNLVGTGFGIKGRLGGKDSFFPGNLTYEAALGWALEDTERIEAGDLEGHFNVSYQF